MMIGDRVKRSPIACSEGAAATVMPKPKPKELKGAAAPGREATKGDAAFELWLQRGLHQIYDTIAEEPVPEELLRLIEEDRNK